MSERITRGENTERAPREAITMSEKAEVLMDIEESALRSLTYGELQAFVKEHGLHTKSEFHITLVGGKASLRILEVLARLPHDEQIEHRAAIEKLFTDAQWDTAFKDIFYYLKRSYNDPDPKDPTRTIPETRETLIQLVSVPGLEEIHKKLSLLIGSSEPILSLPHVTLFSNSTREDKKQRGIGVYSEDDLFISNAQQLHFTP
jgi:hypothetical protein